MKIIRLISLAVVIAAVFVLRGDEVFAVNAPQIEDVYNIGIYDLVANEDKSDFEVKDRCTDEAFNRYEELSLCKQKCDECVLDDDLCWSCKNRPVTDENLSWWGKLKNWVIGLFKPVKQAPPVNPSVEQEKRPGFFKKLFDGIIGYIIGKSPETPKDVIQKGVENGLEKAKIAGRSISDHANGNAKGEEGRIDEELKSAIAEAPDMGTLLKLRSLILVYCSNKHAGDYEAETKCRNQFMDEFKKRGDELKEKLFAEIDPNDTSGNTYKKMEQLRSLLLAGQNARGEGEWFSTDNINKVMNGLKQKMQQWFEKALLEAELEDMAGWYSLAMAYTSAYESETGGSKGVGLFEGADPLSQVRYRARRLALQRMMLIDVCNPDPQKLREFQQLLAKTGCEQLLGNAKACEAIAKGDLETAYALLYNQDNGDEANDLSQNKASEPVECKKKKITETQTRTLEDTSKVNGDSAVDVQNGADQKEQMRESLDNLSEDGDGAQEQGLDVTGDSAVQDVAVDVIVEKPVTDTSDTGNAKFTGDGDNNVFDEQSEQPINEPQIEPEPMLPPEPEPIAEPITIIDQCLVNIFPDPVIGWNYSVQNCSKTYSQAFSLFIPCGSPPPLAIAEQLESGAMCYETAGGFIDRNVIIPCHPLPIPPPHVSECVARMLME